MSETQAHPASDPVMDLKSTQDFQDGMLATMADDDIKGATGVPLGASMTQPVTAVTASSASPPAEDVQRVVGTTLGSITIQLDSAANLASKDTFGKSDPFVEMFLVPPKGIKWSTGVTRRSKTIDNNLNPVWKEQHRLSVPSHATGDWMLRLHLQDEDPVGADDLGKVDLLLSKLFPSGFDPAHPTVPPHSASMPERRVTVQGPFSVDGYPKASLQASVTFELHDKLHTHRLKVWQEQMANTGNNSTRQAGQPQPPRSGDVTREPSTQVDRKRLDTQNAPSAASDNDRVNVAPQASSAPAAVPEKVKESKTQSQAVPPATAPPVEDKADAVVGTSFGSLLVELEAATNLASKDWFGKSDPFVEMFLVPPKGIKWSTGVTRRSKTIDNTLNPVWKEQHRLSVPSHATGEWMLRLHLQDKDPVGADDLGKVDLLLSKLFPSGFDPAHPTVPPHSASMPESRVTVQGPFSVDGYPKASLQASVTFELHDKLHTHRLKVWQEAVAQTKKESDSIPLRPQPQETPEALQQQPDEQKQPQNFKFSEQSVRRSDQRADAAAASGVPSQQHSARHPHFSELTAEERARTERELGTELERAADGNESVYVDELEEIQHNLAEAYFRLKEQERIAAAVGPTFHKYGPSDVSLGMMMWDMRYPEPEKHELSVLDDEDWARLYFESRRGSRRERDRLQNTLEELQELDARLQKVQSLSSVPFHQKWLDEYKATEPAQYKYFMDVTNTRMRTAFVKADSEERKKTSSIRAGLAAAAAVELPSEQRASHDPSGGKDAPWHGFKPAPGEWWRTQVELVDPQIYADVFAADPKLEHDLDSGVGDAARQKYLEELENMTFEDIIGPELDSSEAHKKEVGVVGVGPRDDEDTLEDDEYDSLERSRLLSDVEDALDFPDSVSRAVEQARNTDELDLSDDDDAVVAAPISSRGDMRPTSRKPDVQSAVRKPPVDGDDDLDLSDSDDHRNRQTQPSTLTRPEVAAAIARPLPVLSSDSEDADEAAVDDHAALSPLSDDSVDEDEDDEDFAVQPAGVTRHEPVRPSAAAVVQPSSVAARSRGKPKAPDPDDELDLSD